MSPYPTERLREERGGCQRHGEAPSRADKVIFLPSGGSGTSFPGRVLTPRRATSGVQRTWLRGSRAPRRIRSRLRSATGSTRCASWSAPFRRGPVAAAAAAANCPQPEDERSAEAPAATRRWLTFCAVRAALRAAARSPFRASARCCGPGSWMRAECHTRLVAARAASATASCKGHGEAPSLRRIPTSGSRCDEHGAEQEQGDGSTGSCHIQSKVAVMQNAAAPASAAPPGFGRRTGAEHADAPADDHHQQERDEQNEADGSPARRASGGRASGCRGRPSGRRHCEPTSTERADPVPVSGFVAFSLHRRAPELIAVLRRRCRAVRRRSLGLFFSP